MRSVFQCNQINGRPQYKLGMRTKFVPLQKNITTNNQKEEPLFSNVKKSISSSLPIYILQEDHISTIQIQLDMASVQGTDFPYPSPPHHPWAPPPPHIPQPPPSPDSDTTVVVILFVSFGGIFFLAFLLVGLCCLIRNSRTKKVIKETDLIKADEHVKVNEAIVAGPHGKQAVVLSIEEDVHAAELIRKEGLQGRALDSNVGPHEIHDHGVGTSSDSVHPHILGHKS